MLTKTKIFEKSENGLILLPFKGTTLYILWHSFHTYCTRSVEWQLLRCQFGYWPTDYARYQDPFRWIVVNRSYCLSIHCIQQPTILFKHLLCVSCSKYWSRKCKWNKLAIYSIWIHVLAQIAIWSICVLPNRFLCDKILNLLNFEKFILTHKNKQNREFCN